MSLFKKHEIEKKSQQAAESRGQAAAFTTVGTAGAVGWGAVETAPLWADAAWLATDTATLATETTKFSKSTWKKIGFATAAVTLGALGIALYKHNKAHKLEAEKQKLLAGDQGWADKIKAEAQVTKPDSPQL